MLNARSLPAHTKEIYLPIFSSDSYHMRLLTGQKLLEIFDVTRLEKIII